MAGIPRRGRGAAVIGLATGILLGSATTWASSPVPTPPPISFRALGSAPTPSQPFVWAGSAVSDVALIMLGEKIGPITSIAGDGDSRLLLTLRDGRIVTWNGTRLLRRTFLDLRDRVSVAGAGGLFSIAIDPDPSTGFVFVTYTDKAGELVLARFRRSRTKKNRADPKSGVSLLTLPFPSDADHYGGGLQFGPDGYLYAGIGDGGSDRRSTDNAQRDDILLGKILRLDARAPVAPYYAIPPSNPFVGAGPPLDEIWAKGLRDPWRLSFDRVTGDMYIGDVGAGAPQKIDFQSRSSLGGENYGWPSAAPGSLDLRAAALAYSRPDACAVVGGYVYRGTRDQRLSGVYFYGDYCTGFIWGRGQVTNVLAPKLTTFGEDTEGELYAATESGNLYRLTSTLPSAAHSQASQPLERYVEPTPIPEPFVSAETEPPSPPVGSFVPPSFDSPFPTPPPISVALPEVATPVCADASTPVDSPPPDSSAPPPPAPPPAQNSVLDRQALAPPPPHAPPRAVEPRR